MTYRSGILIIISLLLHFAAATFVRGQDTISPVKDTVRYAIDSSAVFWFTQSRIDTTTDRTGHAYDTAIYNFQNYDPLLESQTFSQTNGNIGQAHKNLFFRPLSGPGFDLGIHSFDGYLYSFDNVKYYSSVAPFTELKLVMGSRKEQFFRVIHSHTIKKQLVIAANFRIINALGRKSFRQKADDVNSCFTAYYNTKNKRYGAFAHYYYNRIKNMENGGIVNDTMYEEFRKARNVTQFDYGLKNALNVVKENAWFLKQYVSLDFRKPDSASKMLKGINLGRLTLTSSYRKPRFIYTDQDATSGFFPLVYTDSLYTSDSVYYKKIENTLAWTNSATNRRGELSVFRFYASFTHANIEIHEQPASSYLNQYTPSAGFGITLFKRLHISASGKYVIGDYNNSDMAGDACLSYRFGKEKYKGTMSLLASFTLAEAPWIAHHFYSNYYRWDFDFDKQQVVTAGLKYSYPRLEAGINWNSLYKPVYWDAYTYPRQYLAEPVNIYSFYANKDFVIGIFELDNKVLLQYSDHDRIFHLPLLVASQSYLLTFDLFKKALRMQLGIEGWYNTPYYADAWMPATRQYHLQYERKVGNYVYLDFFVNLKIKRALLFLTLDHFNSGLMGYNYYLTPHYPTTDRSFRFGVNWLFHD